MIWRLLSLLPGPSAQELYTAIMRDEVAPALRGMGLSGSGQRYRMRAPGFWAQIGFQKSRGNDADLVKFTVNVSVIEQAAWERDRQARPYLPARPSPHCIYGVEQWTERIGILMPSQADHWWKVRSGWPTTRIAAEVVTAIADYGLPAMKLRIEDLSEVKPPDIEVPRACEPER
ncbi:DUF4304 domain-containing protein [Spirillospora sp. CA-253888]